MITFAEHQVRAGKGGAPKDFEQMLGLLVRATSAQDASLVFGNPGDWGIDVLAGSLNGRVTVWQAKYFTQGIGPAQQAQIRSSFANVVARAAEHGFTIDRWVLCAPASMDTKTSKWWDAWKASQERATGIAIELWDENVLRELLLTKEAAAVYQEYYGTRPTTAPQGTAIASAAAASGPVGGVRITATAGRDAYAAGRDVNVHRDSGTKRLIVAVSAIIVLISVATTAVVLFAAHDAGNAGNTKTPRTPQAWAAQVNAACQRMNPKLDADLKRINGFPQNAYGSPLTMMDPALPLAYDQFYADYSKTNTLVQDIPEPSAQNSAVSNWLTAWTNRNETLSKADNYISNASSHPLDRLPSFYEVEKFVWETGSMRPLAAQVGVPECV